MIRRLFMAAIALSLFVAVGAAVAGTLPPGGSFTDDDGNIHEASIEAIAAEGITRGCNPPKNDLYCPDDTVTRGQMAAFLVRALGLTTSDPGIDFTDDEDSIFEADIERLATAGITRGCNPPANTMYCPNDTVTRGQMAAFLVRALGLTDAGTVDFVDDDGSIFETDIEILATAGITLGCNPPTNDRYCPNDPVKRDQMATFLTRAVELTPLPPPERGTIPLDGSGNDVITLDFGSSAYIAVLDITHTGSSNIIVWLRSLQTSDDLLVNEIGPYSGQVAFQIEPNVDDYLLEIQADGNWNGGIRLVETDEGFDPVPSNHSGTGDGVVFFEQATAAFVEFSASHTGSSNFIVWVYDIASDDRDLIVNEIGLFSGVQVEALMAGHYVIDITADGAWGLNLSRP